MPDRSLQIPSVSVRQNGGGAPDNVFCIKAVTPALGLIGTGSLANKNAEPFYRYCMGPDLTGVFIGDHGTMGVKTEISMKMYPWPEVIEYQTNMFVSREQAIKSYQEKLRTGYMDDALLIYYAEDIIGTILPDLAKSSSGIGCIELYTVEEDDEKVAEAKVKALDRITKKYKGIRLGPLMAKLEHEEAGPTAMVAAIMAKAGPWVLQCHARPVGSLLNYSKKCDDQYKRSEYSQKGFTRQGEVIGIGRGHVSAIDNLFNTFGDQKVLELTEKYATEGKNKATELGGTPYWMGHAWYDHAYLSYTPAFIAYYKAIKRALDPNNIMNPGAFNIEELD